MKRLWLVTFIWFMVAACQMPAEKQGFYKVIHVTDGDTFTILKNGHKQTIRLIGVNAPETHHPTKGEEPWGPEAFEFLKRLLDGKYVRLEADKETHDKYGRTLAYVYLEDGLFVNAELVKQGFARSKHYPPNLAHQDELDDCEREAKENKLNMWSGRDVSP